MSIRRTSSRSLRRGYTLVESMIASALLAVSVVGVSEAILSSYAHDVQSVRQHDAVVAAESLRDELSALPMEAASAGDVGLMDFASYSDTVTPGQMVVASAAKARSKQLLGGLVSITSSNSGVLGVTVGINLGLLGGTTGSATSSNTNNVPTSTSSLPVRRTVNVVRRSTINGTADPAGQLAIVTINTAVGSSQTIKIKRLVSTTEAAANAGGSQ